MKTSKRLFLSLILVGVVGLILNSPLANAAPKPSNRPPHPCCKTAIALREATAHEAMADFWVSIANALNDPDTKLKDAILEAWAEYAEELELAEEQFEARLDACEELGHGMYDPEIESDEFSEDIDNNYLPFVPGRTLVYEKQTPDGLEEVQVTTLHETVEIDGVECRIINDIESLDGEVEEDTVDWVAQHDDGSVWYFGEIAKNYEDGLLDNLDGSWKTGKDDAKPGILMKALPLPGDMYRMEYLVNEAEDLARVISLNETVSVPYGVFTNCIKTEEWSPLEPEAVEYKYYAPGIGLVLEFDLETGESLELIQILN